MWFSSFCQSHSLGSRITANSILFMELGFPFFRALGPWFSIPLGLQTLQGFSQEENTRSSPWRLQGIKKPASTGPAASMCSPPGSRSITVTEPCGRIHPCSRGAAVQGQDTMQRCLGLKDSTSREHSGGGLTLPLEDLQTADEAKTLADTFICNCSSSQMQSSCPSVGAAISHTDKRLYTTFILSSSLWQ